MANLFNKDAHGMVGNANAMTGNSNTYPTEAPRQQGGLENTTGSHFGGSTTSNRANNNLPGENLAGGLNTSSTQTSGLDGRQPRTGGLHAGHGLGVTGENATSNSAASGQQMRDNNLRNQNTILGNTGRGPGTGNLSNAENLVNDHRTAGFSGQQSVSGLSGNRENVAGGNTTSNIGHSTHTGGLRSTGENLVGGHDRAGALAGQQSQTSGVTNTRENIAGDTTTRHHGHSTHTSGLASTGENLVGGNTHRTGGLTGQHTQTGGIGNTRENVAGGNMTSNIGHNTHAGGLHTTGENLAGDSRTGNLTGQQSGVTGSSDRRGSHLVGPSLIEAAGGPPPSSDLNSRGSVGGSGTTDTLGGQQPRGGSIGGAQPRASNIHAGTSLPGAKTTTDSGRQTLHGNLDPRDAPTNSIDVGPPDATQHPPSVFSQHVGEPKIEHDYPEDSTVRRHSVSHQEKHILG